uniref:DNA2/NAM7 helicase-like C-terminal domain-containing protein n=1 Tax=Salix viminalis TaxID=40686 RepID=A0A6N2MJN7_SALVM
MSNKSASFHEIGVLGPYLFYDITDGQSFAVKKFLCISSYNERETEAAVELLSKYSSILLRRIGIITPYRCQLSLLRSRFSSAFGSSVVADMDSNGIGFVADERRMNVALTRAKLSLWILGNARTLQTNQNWAALVKDAKERNLAISAKQPYESLLETAPRDARKR